MAKSPAYQRYPAEQLADPDNALMSLKELGAVTLLLDYSWLREPQGRLPADEDIIRRLARMDSSEWTESRGIILKKFPTSPDGAYRANPAILAQVEKQEAFRKKQAENGRAGGRPPKNPGLSGFPADSDEPDQNNPSLPGENPGLSKQNPSLSKTKAKKSSSISISIETSAADAASVDCSEPFQLSPETQNRDSLYPGREKFEREFAELFWPKVWKKHSIDGARSAYVKARKRATCAEIIAGLERDTPLIKAYFKANSHLDVLAPARWLNEGRWADESDRYAIRSNGRPTPAQSKAIENRVCAESLAYSGHIPGGKP